MSCIISLYHKPDAMMQEDELMGLHFRIRLARFGNSLKMIKLLPPVRRVCDAPVCTIKHKRNTKRWKLPSSGTASGPEIMAAMQGKMMKLLSLL